MMLNASVSWALSLGLVYPIIALILTTFVLVWSRNRVLTWQQRTYRKYMISRTGSKKLLTRNDSIDSNEAPPAGKKKHKHTKKIKNPNIEVVRPN